MTYDKNWVKDSYNEQAKSYSEHTRMQSQNLLKLIDYMENINFQNSDIRLLDAGCGTGILVDEINRRESRLWQNDLSINYFGLDISSEMIVVAREMYSNYGTFEVGDLENIPFNDEYFDLVISNSVLHWLNVPESGLSPIKALQEINRVLKPGGIFSGSVSGYGTAHRFQTVFHQVIENWINVLDLDRASIRKDPIGSMKLVDLVDMTLSVGLKVEFARLDYEPVIYSCTNEYVEDVTSYGYLLYTGMIPANERHRFWLEVSNLFEQLNINGEYNHDQYMNYIVARKI